MREALKVEYADESCMMASWRCIGFPVFGHRPPTVLGAEALGRAIEGLGRKVGRSSLYEITLLDTHAPTPSADVRSALDGMVPRLAPYYACTTAIFEGAGFRAAMIRGILTGFQLLSRHKYPQKVFASAEECAPFVLALTRAAGKLDCDVAELVEVIHAVRAEAERRDVLAPLAR